MFKLDTMTVTSFGNEMTIKVLERGILAFEPGRKGGRQTVKIHVLYSRFRNGSWHHEGLTEEFNEKNMNACAERLCRVLNASKTTSANELTQMHDLLKQMAWFESSRV